MKRRSLKTVTGLFFMLALFMSFTSSASAASSRSSINSPRSFYYLHIAAQIRQRVHIYSLQAQMYVAEEDNQPNHPLHARTPFPPGAWETFYIVSANDGNPADFNIQSAQNSLYVAEEDNQPNHPLHARTPFPPGAWEKFRFAASSDTNVCDGQTLAIYSVQAQLYVAEEDNQAGHPLNARTPLSSSGTLGPWEQFQIECF